MKSMKEDKKEKEKDKSGPAEKEGQESSSLKTAGAEGEITAGLSFSICYYILLIEISCSLNSPFSTLLSCFFCVGTLSEF